MTSEMEGKVCLVTGALGGIGKCIALGLAERGATVVAVGRDPARGAETVRELVAASGNPRIELLVCDLSSQRSIRDAVETFRARHDRLHVLVHQAGVFLSKRQVTVDGIETMLAVNHLAYFLMTHLLLDVMKASAPSRIVIGTGGVEAIGKMHFYDPNFAGKWKPFAALAQAKLGNTLFMHELARRLEGTGVTVNAFQPGGVRTKLGVGSGGPFGWFLAAVRRFGVTPEVAARVPVEMASSPEYTGRSTLFFNMGKRGESSKRSRDPELGRKCWEMSERLTATGGASDSLPPRAI